MVDKSILENTDNLNNNNEYTNTIDTDIDNEISFNNFDETWIHFRKIDDPIIDFHDKINPLFACKTNSQSLIDFELITQEIVDCEDPESYIYFIASNIYEDEFILGVEGTVGYGFDPTTIKLIWDKIENKIYITSSYRLLHSETDYNLYSNKYKLTSGLLSNIEKQSDGTEKLVFKMVEGCEKLEPNINGVPYYRFPRSKDGITIPRVIHNIFKIFQDESEDIIKPEIIIPSEFHYYNQRTYKFV